MRACSAICCGVTRMVSTSQPSEPERSGRAAVGARCQRWRSEWTVGLPPKRWRQPLRLADRYNSQAPQLLQHEAAHLPSLS